MRLRLCNPPAVFVGRERERTLLLDTMARAPVALVCGPGGLGKTSLVQSALHARGPEHLARTLAFSAASGKESGAQLARQVVEALAALAGRGALDRGALSDPEGFISTAVDLADSLQVTIVLDDLHLATGPLIGELLAAVQSYARSSHWVGTTRSVKGLDHLREQTVELAPLSPSALMEAGRRWLPSTDVAAIAKAVEEASGSPFWLKRRLLGGMNAPGDELSLEGLSQACRIFVGRLCVVEQPLPEPVLASFGAPPDPELEELERRGLLE